MGRLVRMVAVAEGQLPVGRLVVRRRPGVVAVGVVAVGVVTARLVMGPSGVVVGRMLPLGRPLPALALDLASDCLGGIPNVLVDGIEHAAQAVAVLEALLIRPSIRFLEVPLPGSDLLL